MRISYIYFHNVNSHLPYFVTSDLLNNYEVRNYGVFWVPKYFPTLVKVQNLQVNSSHSLKLMDFNKVQKSIYAIIGLFCIQISMKKLQSWPIIILLPSSLPFYRQRFTRIFPFDLIHWHKISSLFTHSR